MLILCFTRAVSPGMKPLFINWQNFLYFIASLQVFTPKPVIFFSFQIIVPFWSISLKRYSTIFMISLCLFPMKACSSFSAADQRRPSLYADYDFYRSHKHLLSGCRLNTISIPTTFFQIQGVRSNWGASSRLTILASSHAFGHFLSSSRSWQRSMHLIHLSIFCRVL